MLLTDKQLELTNFLEFLVNNNSDELLFLSQRIEMIIINIFKKIMKKNNFLKVMKLSNY